MSFQTGLVMMMLMSLGPDIGSQDQPGGETLPGPRAVEPELEMVLPEPGLLMPVPPPDPPPQFGRRDVWQLMTPDRAGRFRLRVIYSPSGSFYQYNGAPYPWTTTQPRLYMPYVVD